jgi:peptide/nickel transport system ATP-binding protein
MSFVSVRNLRVRFGQRTVVDGVSFDIAPGECLAIVGESGSGKTITARALLGLAPEGAVVSTDELVVAGIDASAHTEADWRSVRGRLVGLVSQDALVSLDPMRRIASEVAEPIEVHERALTRSEVGARVLRMLADVAIPSPETRARQYPHELSGGLRQRALIASALAAEPVLLVADEPTTALDATVQSKVLELLASLKESGLALLLVSHDLALVAQIADRIAVMQHGRIVETAAAADLLAGPTHPYSKALLDASPTAHAARRTGGEVVLAARSLMKRYRAPGSTTGSTTTVALDDVSLELRAGTTLGIVGESGSGKSTLARLLLAIEPPDSGEVVLRGGPWSSLAESTRRRMRGGIQLIEQDPASSFDPRYTVRRILAEAVAITDARADRPARILELLEQVGLSAEHLGRRGHELSGGQRQRVAIARALARRPSILVCDEPVSALDVQVQAQVLALLESLQASTGLSLVVISHDLAVIAQLSDTLLVMRDGVVVESGEASEVLANPGHPFTRELLDSLPAGRILPS